MESAPRLKLLINTTLYIILYYMIYKLQPLYFYIIFAIHVSDVVNLLLFY